MLSSLALEKNISSSQAEADGEVEDFQTNKILLRAKSDVNAMMSDWFAFKLRISSATPNIAISGQGSSIAPRTLLIVLKTIVK